MYEQFIAPILIWATAVFSQVEKLASREIITIFGVSVTKRVLAVILIVIATIGLGWQVSQTIKKQREIDSLNKAVKVFSDAHTKLFNEASGGTAIGKYAYIVDDEKPYIYEFEFRDGQYENIDRIDLKMNGKLLTKKDVDDLEAAANYDGKLYIMTSHSNNKDGEARPPRQRLLEVSLERGKRGEITRSADNLRAVILKKFADGLAVEYAKKEDNKEIKEVMQIEGLAIDERGYAYLGFRLPLTTDNYALVLGANLNDLFSGKPQFDVFRLELSYSNESYGIASLEYDARSHTILVLGTHPDRAKPSMLCKWERNEARIQKPTKCRDFPVATGTTSDTPKLELILIPPANVSDRVFMFLDTDNKGDGGQINVPRSDIGL